MGITHEYIGVAGNIGTFNQTGGLNEPGYLTISAGSSYTLSGGYIYTPHTLAAQGTFEFHGGEVTAPLVDNAGVLNVRGSATHTIDFSLTNDAGATLKTYGARFVVGEAFTNNGTVQLDADNSSPQYMAIGIGTTGGGSLAMGPDSTLDLNDSNLVIDYSGTSPKTSIQAMLNAAYDGGAWDGTSSTGGIITSSAASALYASNGSDLTGIGYAEASELYGISGVQTTYYDGPYFGVLIDPTTLILQYAVAGDVNMDGVVNANDENIILGNWGDTGMDWWEGDLNYDGVVNILDLNIMEDTWGQTLSGIESPSVLTVPEPDTAPWLILGASAALLPRRRHISS